MTTTLLLTVPVSVEGRPRPSPPSGEVKKKDLSAKHGAHFLLRQAKGKKAGGTGTRVPISAVQMNELIATYDVIKNMIHDTSALSVIPQKSTQGQEEKKAEVENQEIPIEVAVTKEDMVKLMAFAHDYFTASQTPGEEQAKQAIASAVKTFTTTHCADPNEAIKFMIAVNYLHNQPLLDAIAKTLADWIEKTRHDTEADIKSKIASGAVKLAKDETMEDHAAKTWTPIVNDMFGYKPEEQGQSSTVPQTTSVGEGSLTLQQGVEEKPTKKSRRSKKSSSEKTKKGEEEKPEKKEKF